MLLEKKVKNDFCSKMKGKCKKALGAHTYIVLPKENSFDYVQAICMEN